MKGISNHRAFLFYLFILICALTLSQRCIMNQSSEIVPNIQPPPSPSSELMDISSENKNKITSPQEILSGYQARYENYDKTLSTYRSPQDSRWASSAMIVQFDSRDPLKMNPKNNNLGYIWGSFYLWSQYALKHGHKSVFYTTKTCESCNGKSLSSAWCKIAGVLQAWKDYPQVDIFLYTDSDATISDIYFNTSLLDIFNDIAFLPDEPKVVVLNQDGPGHWCQISNMLVKNPLKKFQHCLNSGTFIIRRNPKSLKFLLEWWHLANINSNSNSQSEFSEEKDGKDGRDKEEEEDLNENKLNPFQYDVRQAWPWEQGPLHVAKERNDDIIMVVPHPHRLFMNWARRIVGREMPMMPYCLSHLPAAKCFISHYCTDRAEKVQLAVRAIQYRQNQLSISQKQQQLPSNNMIIPNSTLLPKPSTAWYCTERRALKLIEDMK